MFAWSPSPSSQNCAPAPARFGTELEGLNNGQVAQLPRGSHVVVLLHNPAAGGLSAQQLSLSARKQTEEVTSSQPAVLPGMSSGKLGSWGGKEKPPRSAESRELR